MKFACQTIIFGYRITDIEYVLATIHNLGFEGVEISQLPEMIRRYNPLTKRSDPIPYIELISLCQRYQLELLGLAGGTLLDRVKYVLGTENEGNASISVADNGSLPHYYFIEFIDDTVRQLAQDYNLKLALHTHVFTRVTNVEQIKRFPIEQNPYLYYLPDTAHLYIANQNPAKSIAQLQLDRIICVHIKDWDSAYGRSYHRYARGFAPLGQGEVPLKEVLQVLKDRGYTGWIVVEHDYARVSFQADLAVSINWLNDQGFKLEKPSRLSRPLRQRKPRNIPIPDSEQHKYRELSLNMWLSSSNDNLNDYYSRTARLLQEHFESLFVGLWSCSRARDDMSLLSFHCSETSEAPTDYRLNQSEALIGSEIETRRVSHYDLAAVNPDDKPYHHGWIDLLGRLDAKTIETIPICDPCNIHHIHMLISLIQPERNMRNYGLEASRIADTIARSAQAALDSRYDYVIGKVNHIALKSRALPQFLTQLKELVLETIECQGVTIFLEDHRGERLHVVETTGVRWADDVPSNDKCYTERHTKHSTVKVWRLGQPLLLYVNHESNGSERFNAPRSQEYDGVDPTVDNVLIVPIIGSRGNPKGLQQWPVIGVIRCRNKKPIEECDGRFLQRYLTDDDAALVDAICNAAVPYIELLRSDLRRDLVVRNIIHELRFAMPPIIGAASRLRDDLNGRVINLCERYPDVADKILEPQQFMDYTRLMRYDYIDDISAWCSLMVNIVNNTDIYGLRDGKLKPNISRTLLMADVIAPIVRQMKYLTERRKFSADNITYDSFKDVPALHIDKGMFQQVFFNLLSNAIKYAYNDRRLFRVEITGKRVNERRGNRLDWYRISCRDWGPGILAEQKETIFEEGVRGPESLNELAVGLGLGLWIVKQIVEAHDGFVEVTNLMDPTEISLFLPTSLSSSGPARRS